MRPFVTACTLFCAIYATCGPIHGVIYQRPETGSYYTWFSGPLTWEQADAFSLTYTTHFDGNLLDSWHLATITSPEENQFVFETVLDSANGMSQGAFLGGIITDGTLYNWQWVTGEPFSYSNFYPTAGHTYVRENVIEMGGQWGAYWNDEDGPGSPYIVSKSFIMEHPPISPIPEPSTYALLGIGALGLVVAQRRRRSAV